MRKLLFILALPVLLGIGQPATAQQPACAPRAQIIAHLGVKYSETSLAIGLANNGGILEVLASPEGKSWTIILTMPNGTACMIAAGENWESVPQKILGEPS